jgi:hypothetical protein
VVALGELLQPVQLEVVAAGEDETSLAQSAEQAPAGVERGEQ